jgi:ABC-type Na+ efflux pump permease subunit
VRVLWRVIVKEFLQIRRDRKMIPVIFVAPIVQIAVFGFAVNTATGLAGGSFPDVQAFPALTHYNDSAAEAVGMYGNVYDVVVRAHHDGSDGAERRVSVVFASLSGDLSLSRFWDGVGLVDGQPVVLQHTPANRKSLVAELTRAPGEVQEVRFQAMVPGLTSIPQALYLVSH